MKPRLLGLAGPQRGLTVALSHPQEVAFGNGGEVAPQAGEALPAEWRAAIRGADGKFTFCSAGSGDGVLLNGAPAGSRVLEHGDHIQIGESRWLFLLEEVLGDPRAEGWRVWSAIQHNEVICQQCGACVAVCPSGAMRVGSEGEIQHDMVGQSAAMRRIYEFIGRVANTDATVLLYGESGTGKELAARAIHRNSRRMDKPFVAINCAALAAGLLESELFGHEKGAFTGAFTQKKGKLEIAEGGTVFLDEIAELDPALQVKLLRVLQEREMERVGGTQPTPVDFRLVAATNRELEEAVRAGRFRSDLYYRLNVVSIRLPPLRERREDIPLLADCFLAHYCQKCDRVVRGLSPEVRECLMSYDWPGNVRELQNAIERALVLGSAEVVLIEDLPESILEGCSPGCGCGSRYHEGVRESKRQLILRAMDQSGGSYKDAAELLGIHPNYLHRLIRNLGLRPALKKGVG